MLVAMPYNITQPLFKHYSNKIYSGSGVGAPTSPPPRGGSRIFQSRGGGGGGGGANGNAWPHGHGKGEGAREIMELLHVCLKKFFCGILHLFIAGRRN